MADRPGISSAPLAVWLERIEEAQEAIRSVQAAQTLVAQANRYRERAFPGADLYQALHDVELECWRNLFMFALTVPRAEMDRIKAAAKERFLGRRAHVAEHLGQWSPSAWVAADEDEFRERVREVFAPEGDRQ